MKRFLVVLSCAFLAAALLLAIPPASSAADESYARIVRLSYVQGDVQIARPDQKGWEGASVNTPIQQGFTIGTNEGRAAEEFESGATVYIAENTVVEFTALALVNGGRVTQLTLNEGSATFIVNPTSEDSFTIVTPQIQLTLADRVTLRLDVFKDGSTVSVMQGSASVDSPAGTKTVSKGQTLAYGTASSNQVRMTDNPPKDEWDHWVSNREQGSVAATGKTMSYTSAPFQYGLADLAQYGAWNYFSGYGFGWQPFGCSTAFTPFLYGQWVYYQSLGWTWLSDEPWGWLPYHFGSWGFAAGCGWFWLPGGFNYWNAAPVRGMRRGKTIGWIPRPLPPRITSSHALEVPALPTEHMVVSGGDRIGGKFNGHFVVTGPSGNPVEISPAPPGPDGHFGKTVGEGSAAVASGGSAGSAAFVTNLNEVGSPLVPTGPGALRVGSGIFYDPVEHRFVNGGSNPPITVNGAPLARVAQPVAPRSFASVLHSPNASNSAHGRPASQPLLRPHPMAPSSHSSFPSSHEGPSPHNSAPSSAPASHPSGGGSHPGH